MAFDGTFKKRSWFNRKLFTENLKSIKLSPLRSQFVAFSIQKHERLNQSLGRWQRRMLNRLTKLPYLEWHSNHNKWYTIERKFTVVEPIERVLRWIRSQTACWMVRWHQNYCIQPSDAPIEHCLIVVLIGKCEIFSHICVWPSIKWTHNASKKSDRIDCVPNGKPASLDQHRLRSKQLSFSKHMNLEVFSVLTSCFYHFA